ncbi:MAG: hypothetical protein ACLVJ6_15090 [Merdibacter sp.]
MKKRKMISAMLALLMSVTAVSGMSVSGVRAQTNEEKAREIVADMTLEEDRPEADALFPQRLDDAGQPAFAVATINDEIYDIIGTYDIGSVILFANFDPDATVNVG